VLFPFSGFFAGNFILLLDLFLLASFELRSLVFEIGKFLRIVPLAFRLQRRKV
jgi:hypothetical protein